MCESMVWTSCSNNDLKRILPLQKRSTRIFLGVDSRSRTVESFEKLKWLPLYDDAEINNNTLAVAFSLAFLELRLRNEEAIKVFRYSFSEAISIFFNRYKSDFILN